MSLPAETQVLVVGAGPNGMACAITLASLGLQVTLVDALAGGKYGSRASLVHPHTLEVLDTVGLAKPLLEIGIHSTGVTFHGGAEKLIEVDVSLLHETQFPTTLLIPQHHIERVFQERLAAEHVEIFRNRKAVGMREAPGERGVEVSFEDGATICARYIVGADGSRSSIRRLAAIDFRDPHTAVPYDVNEFPDSALQIVLGDLYFEEPLPESLPRDAVSWYLNGRLLFCPLPFPGKADPDSPPVSYWRIAIVIPIGTPAPPRHPDLPYLQAEVDARKPWADKVTITSVSEAATYRVRSAVASTFFKKMGFGSVLLVGDAAHVHSPTGGQGMNLGLCDAIALGHTIHRHVDGGTNGEPGQDPDQLLVKYSSSRQKTAITVIGMVKDMTAVINISPPWKKSLRNWVMWIAGCLPFVKKRAAWRLSGLIHRGN